MNYFFGSYLCVDPEPDVLEIEQLFSVLSICTTNKKRKQIPRFRLGFGFIYDGFNFSPVQVSQSFCYHVEDQSDEKTKQVKRE